VPKPGNPYWVTTDEAGILLGSAAETKLQKEPENLTISKAQSKLRHIDTWKHCQIATNRYKHNIYAWECKTRWELNLLV
jgi:hypothetical protein